MGCCSGSAVCHCQKILLGIKPKFTEGRQRRSEKFSDEYSSDYRLNDAGVRGGRILQTNC